MPSMATHPPLPTSVYRAMAEQEKHEEVVEFNEKQIKLLSEQNEQLRENFNKLEDLYKIKETELEESKTEAKKAKKYNITMLIIALVSAGIALASLVATILIAVL